MKAPAILGSFALWLIIASLLFLWLVFPRPAPAEQPAARLSVPLCQPNAALLSTLLDRFGESQAAFGVATGGENVLEITADPDDGSWTALLVGRDGNACIVAAGEGWETVPGWGVRG